MEKMATGFNDCVIELVQQITDLKQELGKSYKELSTFRINSWGLVNRMLESIILKNQLTKINPIVAEWHYLYNNVVDKNNNQSYKASIRDICENHQLY